MLVQVAAKNVGDSFFGDTL